MKFLCDFLYGVSCLTSGIAGGVCVEASCPAFGLQKIFQLMLSSSVLGSVLGMVRLKQLLQVTGAQETKLFGCLADSFCTWGYKALESYLGLHD